MSVPEQWRLIPGYPGYQVSDLGRILSTQKRRPRLKKTFVSDVGYEEVSLCRGGRQKPVRVHRLVGEAFLGPLPEGMETRHLNGDPSDNRLANLAYGTASENQRDTVRHGTHRNAKKMQCPQGHAFTEENTYINPGARSRSCRQCKRDRRERRMFAAADVPLLEQAS